MRNWGKFWFEDLAIFHRLSLAHLHTNPGKKQKLKPWFSFYLFIYQNFITEQFFY